ncbi:pullulanase-type alpha-1,6-glucosidase [Oscillochloris sp. ZM17-4]|uniref:pullulanase-type alpha-1,6-glucosidase n=1 Tax=Oscillochloris sp. ZM17-4 TaxID=2866714 RepID=UPI001C73DB1F|nr:pullulanase-type alpha-1,6-glucosidase [Oscillochloris sp. ZM17-4]MBX0331387.1 pullulanase-type alpha-1,6-glucosidase [Oscillochloris sp. ZM17-4]
MSLRRWSLVAAMLPALALLLAPLAPPAAARQGDGPRTVTIPGTIQSALGCPGDWQPACAGTYLAYDPAADVWSARFDLPAGEYEYKVALNDSWAENYGLNATQNGPNIPLVLAKPASVRFAYDHKTHWVADSVTSALAVVAGDFQAALGCPANDDPSCLASWMQDPQGDGSYAFVTTRIPAGTYRARVALGESLDGALGAGGAPGGEPIPFTVANDGDEIYFGYDVNTGNVTISTEGAPRGDLSKARAHWVGRDTIVWDVIGSPAYSYALFADPAGAISLGPTSVSGGRRIDLSFSSAGPADALQAFPQLAGFSALKLGAADLPLVPELLRGQLAVAAYDQDGRLIDATGLQIPGVLDDLFRTDGALGPDFITISGAAGAVQQPVLRLWAPTARAVRLLRFADSGPDTPAVPAPMERDEATGVWSIVGDPSWLGQYYLYEVEVYVHAEGAVVTNQVTDPYALSLSANSTRSQIVSLDDAALKPDGWDEMQKPALAAPEDIVLYELHIRDFSSFDQSVPAELRGTYRAFALPDSAGVRHLRELADAGVSHVHLLPAFDIATIEERRADQAALPLDQLRALPPDSPEQQALLQPLRDRDGFNWGYDPYHYTVPEGSYSTEPDGPQRIVEFREMVQSLSGMGLRTVMDVVYNHTDASGQAERSVLDKIVPGYYHRLDADGAVTNSTCCANTATEHAMMEKLMVDSVLTWAREYKVDGFRFDLMGHHMKRNMLALRAALDGLTIERDGVDGRAIYVYGEGWDFGEVAGGARGENATQITMAGTGIGTFSDRLRDAVRGGGPFDGLQDQGFATGLFSAPNATDQGDADAQRARLLDLSDLIKLGLAGNLRAYALTSAAGEPRTGEQIRYRGAPAGYTEDPQEQIVYVSAHDNETLFDAIQLKAPASADVAERARMQLLGLSLVAFAQGVPFFHAGDELLRSKSLDRNSYNSSDWFNQVDWTGQTSAFGVGLPPAGDNEASWPIMAPLLADPALRPGPTVIAATYASFLDLLRVRRSTPLFRLRTAADIQRSVSFLNSGPGQIPGLIVMSISDNGPSRIDPQIGQVVALFNGTPAQIQLSDPAFAGAALILHPVQQDGADSRLRAATFDPAGGTFSVPARSAVVFIGSAPVVGLAAAPAAKPTGAPAATIEPTVAPTAAPAPTVALEPTAAPVVSQGNGLPILAGIAVVAIIAAAAIVTLRRRR